MAYDKVHIFRELKTWHFASRLYFNIWSEYIKPYIKYELNYVSEKLHTY